MNRAAALITGAGSSTRMGTGEKKEYKLIDNTPVLVKSILSFQKTGCFAVYAITVPVNHISLVRELVRPYVALEKIEFVEGGATRQESVFKGLGALARFEIDNVLIHDAARPWIESSLIQAVLAGTEKHGACVPVIDSSDAVVEIEETGFVLNHCRKSRFKGVQTPQGFHFTDIFNAHKKAAESDRLFYDDAEILMHAGHKVFTINGSVSNRKITYLHDLGGS